MTKNKSLVSNVLALPRITRILIAGVYALAVTLIITLVADKILGTTVSEETLVTTLSLIAAGIGILMYALGYFLIVGTIGEDLILRRASRIYIWTGIIAICLVMLWTIGLLISGS